MWILGVLWGASGAIAAFSAGKPYLWRIAIFLGPLAFLLIPRGGDNVPPAWRWITKQAGQDDSDLPRLPHPSAEPVNDAPLQAALVRILPPAKPTRERPADESSDWIVSACCLVGVGVAGGFIIGLFVAEGQARRAHESTLGSARLAGTDQPPTAERWTLASPLGTVERIEGRPELSSRAADGSFSWQYNLDDRVIVDAGTNEVIGWRNLSGKLRVYLGDVSDPPSPYREVSILIGAPAGEVLKQLGMPTSVVRAPASDEQVWFYPNAKGLADRQVNFKAGLAANDSKVFGAARVERAQPALPRPSTAEQAQASASPDLPRESAPVAEVVPPTRRIGPAPSPLAMGKIETAGEATGWVVLSLKEGAELGPGDKVPVFRSLSDGTRKLMGEAEVTWRHLSKAVARGEPGSFEAGDDVLPPTTIRPRLSAGPPQMGPAMPPVGRLGKVLRVSEKLPGMIEFEAARVELAAGSVLPAYRLNSTTGKFEALGEIQVYEDRGDYGTGFVRYGYPQPGDLVHIAGNPN
jgi:hypothetical protein